MSALAIQHSTVSPDSTSLIEDEANYSLTLSWRVVQFILFQFAQNWPPHNSSSNSSHLSISDSTFGQARIRDTSRSILRDSPRICRCHSRACSGCGKIAGWVHFTRNNMKELLNRLKPHTLIQKHLTSDNQNAQIKPCFLQGFWDHIALILCWCRWWLTSASKIVSQTNQTMMRIAYASHILTSKHPKISQGIVIFSHFS